MEKQPFDIDGRLLKVGDPVTSTHLRDEARTSTGVVVATPKGPLVEVRQDEDGVVWRSAAGLWRFGVNALVMPKLCDTHEALRAAVDKEARRVYGKDVYIKQLRAVPGELMVGAMGREIKVWEPTYTEAQKTMLACLKGMPSFQRCGICHKPGHNRKKCPDNDTVKARNLRERFS